MNVNRLADPDAQNMIAMQPSSVATTVCASGTLRFATVFDIVRMDQTNSFAIRPMNTQRIPVLSVPMMPEVWIIVLWANWVWVLRTKQNFTQHVIYSLWFIRFDLFNLLTLC